MVAQGACKLCGGDAVREQRRRVGDERRALGEARIRAEGARPALGRDRDRVHALGGEYAAPQALFLARFEREGQECVTSVQCPLPACR